MDSLLDIIIRNTGNTESLHQEFTLKLTTVAKLQLNSNTTNFIFGDHHNMKNFIKESQHLEC